LKVKSVTSYFLR